MLVQWGRSTSAIGLVKLHVVDKGWDLIVELSSLVDAQGR